MKLSKKRRAQLQCKLVEALLNKKQQEIYKDDNRYKIIVAGRRSSKSYGLAAFLIMRALSCPNSNCAYIALTRESAKKIIWDYIIHILKRAHVKVITNLSNLTIRFENGSVIYVSGCATARDAERYRGQQYSIIAIDEAGATQFVEDLGYLVDEVLLPTLEDTQGDIVIAGTPNKACVGWLYNICQKPGSYSYYNFTVRDNEKFPVWAKHKDYLPHYDKWWTKWLTQNNKTEEDDDVQREWMARWIRSQESVVFPNIEPNIIKAIPWTDEESKHVVGIDMGQDMFSIICLAFNRKYNFCVIKDHYHESEMIYDNMISKIRDWRELYHPVSTVIDPTPGKQVINDVRKLYQIHIEAAEKRDKVHFVQMLAEGFKLNRIKILSRHQDLIQNLKQLVWINGKQDITGAPMHFMDSLLYAHRRSMHHFPIIPTKPIEGDDDKHWKALTSTIKNEKMRKMRQGR